MATRFLIACGTLLALNIALAQQQGPTPGRNVNVIAGNGPDGDWTLQRQNEPTIACSSRNPQNCLAGANDYRTVDIPFPQAGEKITGDAWLGWYTTKDGGFTWKTRLLPGYPQDTSTAGLASPLKGYAAGADPIIRPGTNGLFYYGGLVFNREEGGGSAIFVSRFIDNNNQEGADGEPIAYVGTSILHRIGAPPVVARRQGRGQPVRIASRTERERQEREKRARADRDKEREGRGRASRVRAGAEQQAEEMVDKPWMAVDVPRAGATMCTVGGPGTAIPLQTFPGGRVYMAYALFDGPGEEHGRIMFTRSSDCGGTWSAPRFLSRVPSADVNDDGVANTADTARVQASFNRTCGQPTFNPNADVNNDCRVDVLDMAFIGQRIGQPVPQQPRLSQGATIAIDPKTGALQIAWRQFNDGVLGDAIVTVRSTNGGASFSAPRVVGAVSPIDQSTTGTSFRTNAYPTLAYDAGDPSNLLLPSRAYLAWSTRGVPGAFNPDPVNGDARIVMSTSTDGATWSAPRPVDNQPVPGHQIMPALTFAQGKLQLIYYDLREDVSQLFERFIDELQIVAPGSNLLRHTIDARGAQAGPGVDPVFTSFPLSQYATGSAPGSQTVQQLEFSPPNLPIFRSGSSPFMGDYIDTAPAVPFVRNGSTWAFNTAPSAGSAFHAIWTDNRDIRPPANGDWTAYTPPTPPFGRPPTSSFDPNQSIPACVPGQAGMRNQNIYTTRITEGLVVGAVTNARQLGGTLQRSFPVYAQNNSTVIRTYRLAIANQPVGGQASFKQFEQLTTLDVQVPRKSTVARTVFVRSSDPHARVAVTVTEITAPNGTVVPGGQQGTIILNPDPTNPDIENPDIENPDIENPDIENSEVYNPDIENARVANPDIENPDIENPDIENPDIENVRVANPNILNPDIENPDIENPDIENPDIENPDIENADLVNGALSDTTWTLTNKGNAAAAFSVKLLLNQQLPPGFRSQLIAHKVYQTPTVLGCSLLKQSQTVLLANVPNPRFATAAEISNPDIENPDIENVTVAIAPGETVRITLRVFDPNRNDAVTYRAADSVTPAAVAQAVNTAEADAGITQPTVAAAITTDAPAPGGTTGGAYSGSLESPLPGTWTVVSGDGTVPPGLTVDPNTGAITGTPTTPGTYTFTARFTSTTGITDYQTVTITVGAVGAAANVGVSASAPASISIGTPFALTINVSNAGPAAATNVQVTDTLPEGTTFVSATTTSGACQHLNGTLTCSLGTLASGGAASIVLTVRPTIGGSHQNTVVVSAAQADPVATNNTAVTTASTTPTVTPCTTVCFSGPTSFIAGDFDVPFGAEKGDFNEDGYLDLIYGPVGVNTIGILLNNGAGGFGPHATMTIPGSPEGGAVADYDNDGHLDIIVISQDVPEAWLLRGNGLGTFAAPATIPLANGSDTVVTADFNHDGNADLALGSSGSGAVITVRLGNGNGTFQPATTFGTTTTNSAVLVDDFNNDGNPDLAAHNDGVGLMIVLGSGASGFQPPTSIALLGASGVIKVGDLTGDGFADLIVGIVSPTENVLRLFVGNGSGGFTPTADMGGGGADESPSVGDLDSDGDIDLVWPREGGGIVIQLNDGTGAFTTTLYLATPGISAPVVADFNNDGRPDIVAPLGGAFRSQVLVFLNTCDQPPADLAVTVQGPAAPVAEGSDVTYNITVTNSGPNPATGVQLDFSWSSIADLVSVTGSDNCTIDRTRLACQLGTLGVAPAAITVVVRPRAGGTLASRAGVTATTADPNPANNTTFVDTIITPGASTLVVTNTNDSGPGSLFQAIFESNDPGPRDTITFNIPGSGPHTITATTRNLPNIVQPVVIDATTQPGYTEAGPRLIEINGQNTDGSNGLQLTGNSGGSVIRGLAINRFPLAGILLASSGSIVESNFIGTSTSGTTALPNGQFGILISGANNTIGGLTTAARNLISGNSLSGVVLTGAGATGNLVIGNFIGTNAAGTAALGNGGDGIGIQSDRNTIGGTAVGAGNLISGNLSDGIQLGLGGTNNLIQGNRIGTNAAGTAAIPNTFRGIFMFGGATNNTVGGTAAGARNILSGNTTSGIQISDAGTTGNVVSGNFIGTNAAGTAALQNGSSGVLVQAPGNTIGGIAAGAGNLVSGNVSGGVNIATINAVGNSVLGNLIGTNAAGTAAVPNGNNGINVFNGATNTTVGGATVAARNVVSGNLGSGIRIQDVATTGTSVRGNFVGTNITGTGAIPNGNNGVEFGFATAGNTLGGAQPGEGNLISGNTNTGVGFFTVGPGGNTMINNLVGTDASGTAGLGNGANGVLVLSNGNSIGSLATGLGNAIAFNGSIGVRVDSGTGNAIVNNRIFSNGSLGIDLAPLGVTANDADDADTGPNTLLNFPLLSSARTVGSDVRVQVNLTPPPSSPFQVHFYASPSCDASGAGEGATPIGVATLSGSPNPSVNFEMSFPVSLVPAGSVLTATTTDSGNNTSEFSFCEQVDPTAGTANLQILMTDSPDPVAVGSPLTYNISVNNLGPDAASNVIVTDVLPPNVTFVSANASIGSCAPSGTTTITVTCTIATINSPASVSIGIVVTPTAAGTLTNTVTASASGTDPVAANNSATSTTIANAAGPTIYVVTNANDSGAGSLRQAILDANAHLGPDLIHFNIPGTGVRQILAINLPTITDPVTIDGTSQPGWAVDRPIVMLSGVEAPPGANGLVIGAGNSVVRALIISRYTGSGIVLQGGDSNVIVGNWLGTGPNGNTAFGNGNGILVLSSGNTIGGAGIGETNVISGNTNGVQIGLLALGNVVIGNLIGTDLSGTTDVGNTEAGVLVIGEANVIGGQGTGNRNVISGNDQAGVRLTGGASANLVAANFIGTDRPGVNPLANGIGVQVGVNTDGTASTNRIGGLVAGEANVIAFNTTSGVVVGQSSSDNAIVGNSIHDNGTLAIDLLGNGVTPNDPGDIDEGANNLTNFPVLTAAAGGVQGTLNSIPDATFRIEFFGNTACDASGNGEGATFLGATAVATDGAGNATIPLFAAAAGQVVTATATDSSNNTSEFSSCVQVQAASAELAITNSDSPDPVVVGTQLGYLITVTNNGPSPATNVSVTQAWNGPFDLNAMTPSQGTCEFLPAVVCSLGTLASGASATVSVAVTPTAIGSLTNTATVQADQPDPVPANNAAAQTTLVIGSANLAISKSDAPDPVVSGSPLVYTLSVFNSGPHTATDVTVTDTLPTGVTLVSAVPSQGSCTGTAVIVCTLGTLLVEQGASVTITVTPTTAGQITNTAVVAGAQNDSSPANNVASQTTTVQGANSTFTVTNTSDSGLGSLRSALEAANLSTGTLDTIVFNILPAGRYTISPASFLPSITDPVIIDGTTQPGYSGTPAIEIEGTNAGTTSNGLFVASGGSGSTIRALAINRFGTGGAPTDLGGAGIMIQGTGGNIIERNFLGTDLDGLLALPNRADGISVDNSPNNVIGGSDQIFGGNLISGNSRSGIVLNGAGTTGTRIQNNRIGLNWPNTLPLGNGSDGIAIFGASQSLIGGPTFAPNLISSNGGAGIRVASGTGNAILSNIISANVGLAIDLAPAGVTANDVGDGDTGANNLQNFPVLTAVTGGIEISFNGQPNTVILVDLFGNTACDASGHGEMETYFGTLSFTTDAAGNLSPVIFPLAAGWYVTATATDSANNTSEASACVLTGAGATLASVTPASGQQGATLDVSLVGENTGFVNGTTTASFGEGITVNSVAVATASGATANITISPTAFIGGRTVTVTTGTQVVINAFSVTAGPAALTALAPSTAQQGQSNLNVLVTGQNTHFVQGVTTATLGGGVIVNSVTVNSPTSATINISIEPFAQDARAVTLITEGEIAASAVNAFGILPGTPRLATVSPGSGQQGQTLDVAVGGQFTSFVNGTTTASFGQGITVNAVTVTSATTANVNITVSPLANVNSRTVTLTTGGQIASSLNAGSFFNVTRSPAAIGQVTPASGRQAEGLSVTVTGTNTHFATGSTAFSFGAGITITTAVVNSPTSATLDLAILPGAALGARTVTATTLGEIAELANGFTVDAGLAAIATVSPSTGRQAERLNLNVTGQFTHFVNGTTIASVGAGITVHAVSVTNATNASLDVTVSPGAAPGARTVVLTTGAELAQLVGGFTVTPGQPTLFSINPVSAIQGTNLTVILSGAFTNFTPQVTTAFFGAGISVGTVTVNGPTLASVPITIAAGAASGQRSVTVTTGSESVTLLNGFTVVQGTPTVTSIDPNAGQQGLTRNVAIAGVFTTWQNTVTSVSYGAGITVNSNVVNSATSLTNNITIDADATLGPRDVVITTGTEVLTVPGGFTVTNVDVTAPTLLRLSPANGSTGVPLNTSVTAEFSEPLSRTTVTTSTFQLYDSLTGQFIATTVSLDATGRVASLRPHQLLAVNRTHYVYLNNPITDVAGNHLPGYFNTFVTGFSTDTVGPTLRLANPQNGDAAVGRNVKVVMQFDRPINAATLGIGVRLQAAGVGVPGTFVLEDGQQRLRFTPASQLAAGTAYLLTLTSELRDVAGNALTNPGTISFTTGPDNDTTLPIVTASTPYYNEADVSRRPVIRAAFSERINPISLTSSSFYLYNYHTNALIRATIAIAPDRLSATLIPDTILEPYSYYYYYLSGFADIAGNVGNTGATYFITSGIEDTVPPTVVSIAPANGTTGVPVNARVRVLMSEPLDGTSASAAIQLTPAVAGTTALSADHLSLVFTPGTNLAVSTVYAVQIGGLRDSAGNTMAPVASSFTTSASPTADTTAPTVVSFSPTNGATGVSVSSPIVMTVSEPIRSFAFINTMRVFATIPVAGSVQLAGTYTVNASGTVVTFTPQVPFPGGTQIFFYSNYDGTTTDLAANSLQSLTSSFTTAAIADTQPPTVVMVTPPDAATGIGPAAVVTLTFSEPLHPSTVNNNTFALFSGATEINPSIARSADNTTVFLTTTLPFDSLITVVATGDVTDTSGNALADFSSTFSTGSSVESNRPQILTQRPIGTGIPASADITLFVSKPLDATTVAGAVYVSTTSNPCVGGCPQNGVLVEGVVTVSGGGTAVHFNPVANFEPGATIQVFVTDDARDLFGNALFPYSGSFTVAQSTTGPPTLVRTNPPSFTSGNPTNSVIDVEFSEPLLPSTVNSTNFYVRDAANLPVAGTLSLRNGDRTIRFTPAAPFAVNNYNYVYPTSGLRDLQNTPFAGTNFYFYAGPASDATAPTLVSIAPTNGATGIGINATVRLYISEGINALTTVAGAMSLSSSAGPIPASVTFNSGNSVVTIVPMVPLPSSTVITVSIDGFEDVAGNRMAAHVSQFTTGAGSDTVRPSVVASNVTAYGVNNVPINSIFQITFDEPMDTATVLAQGGAFLYDYGIGNYVTGTASMSPDGLTLTFVPAGPLSVNRQHGLFMSSGFDLSGNQQVGFSLLFTTVFANDTTPPAVVGVNPPNGLTNVPRNARVEIRFNESISALSLGNVRLLTNGGAAVPVTRTLSDTNRLLTLRPNGLLATNRAYTISVVGVRDTSNNLMAAFTSTFTTGSRTDLVIPTITSTNPVYGDTGVGLRPVARVTFSEPIDPVSISADTFRMAHAAGGDYVDAIVVLATDRRSATLTPVTPLLPYTLYYFTLNGYTDVAGNLGNGTTIYFYTGATLDAVAPTVVSLSPPNGTTGMPVNTRITAVMSELIDPTSVSNASIQLTPAVPGTVTLATDRGTLTLVPSANLATSTAYSILITGLRDTSGNTMAAANSGFTTGTTATPDTTPPTIVSRTPTNGATGQPVTTSVSFTTSERITAAAVGPDSVRVFAALPVGTIQLAGTYSVDASGTVVTFTVTGAFPANATIQWYTNYSSTIRNMAGLPLPSELNQFTTANTLDADGPTVQTVTPSNGASDVGPYSTVALTFSESVNPNTVTANTVSLFVGPTRLSSSLTRSLDNRMVFLAVALPADSTITVFATSGVTDLSGNALVPFTSAFTTAAAFDPNRPSVVTQRPTGSGVSPTTPITLFLNRGVDPATVPGAFFVSQNGVLITGTVTVDSANQAIVFLPTTPFAASASIEVMLTNAATNASGTRVNPYHSSFTIAGDPATTAPALTRTNPALQSINNPPTTVIDLEFSEPLNPTTVVAANVFVRDSVNALVPGTLSLRSGNRVVRFTPSAPFPPTPSPNNYFYVFYTNGLLDLQGAAVAGSNFYFYTSGSGDATSPAVSAIVPSAGSTGVGVNGSIRVTFSEAVNPVSLTSETVSVSAGGTPLGTTMTISTGNRSLTIVPQRPLPAGASITVTVNGVQDPSGNAIPLTTSSFTTGNAPDITPPVALDANILYGDTNVPANTIFEWTYSEPIDATTVVGQQNVLYDYVAGAYIPGAILSVSADGRKVTLQPPANLIGGRQHFVGLSSVADLAGNFGGGTSLIFTTSSAADTTPPQVLAATPASGQTGVPLNARLRVAFDEAISAASVGGINVIVSGLPLPVTARTMSDANRIVTLTLGGLLAPNTVHTLFVDGVRDRAGNLMPAQAAATFTTGTSVDLVPPLNTVVASPAGGATNVPVGTTPTVTFSEAIDPASVIYAGTSGVTLLVAATSQVVPVVYSFSADRRTVTLTPVSPLAAGTQYRLQVSTAVDDVAGNGFGAFHQFLFTTQP